jgi:predicted dehydrogenase
MALLALAAGKHVYVEKPLSHNPHEGELLVEAVKKHRRVLQMGAQRRSFPNMREAVRLIHAGAIGRTYFGRSWYVNRRQPIGKGRPADVPAWLDYDLWQGPAPRRPFRDNLVHYNWHWDWHWGTGEAHNNGTHEVDICRWAMGLDLPVRTASNGGRYHFQGDDWSTPDTQTIAWDFAEGKSMTWEGRSCNPMPIEGLARGVLIHGTEGSALLDGNSYTFHDLAGKATRTVKHQVNVDATNTVSSTGADLDLVHMQDFVDAIRTGRNPNCGVEDGHKSVLMLHLGNISQRCGRSLTSDPATGRIQGDAEAMKLWRRDYEPGWEAKV